MKRLGLLLFTFLFTTINSEAQQCNCEANFEWVKKTFEENDAGFQYVIDQKGKQAYEDHNKRTLEKVKQLSTLPQCATTLYEWLTFFRSGHIAIKLLNNNSTANNSTTTTQQAATQFPNWEKVTFSIEDFEKNISTKTNPGYEGVWSSPPYKIGIKKEGAGYTGFIIESGAETWTRGQVKLKINGEGEDAKATFYLRDHSAQDANPVMLVGKNKLQLGQFNLTRESPKLEEDKEVLDYQKSSAAQKPYLEALNSTTLYLRIPSFRGSEKKAIDSVITANRVKILSTENLIIDITNGTGGDDASFNKLIPILYTNPIRTVGVEYLSTPLNNQRMLDFINDPEYGFNDEEKKWAKTSYDKLSTKMGKFVNLNANVVSQEKYDTVYPYPKNIGIIINKGNGSTDEQFLLAAKQSRKVKLFGATTFGVLDISNMYYVTSPSKEFQLGYALSRSMRIPEMTIDSKGIQPDYYIDKSIPVYKWTSFVNEVLNSK